MEQELRDLIHLLGPLDLTGSREQGNSPRHQSQKIDCSEGSSGTKRRRLRDRLIDASLELCIMTAVSTIDDCKELVAYLNRSGLRNKLPTTTKQEVATRWNANRMMLSSVEQQWTEVKAV